jgi:Kelch motif
MKGHLQHKPGSLTAVICLTLLSLMFSPLLLGRPALAQEAIDSLGWIEFTPLPTPIMDYASAQCSNDLNHFYVIGGRDAQGRILNTVWRYDAKANKWEALEPLPVYIHRASAICYNNNIYLAGGVIGKFPSNRLYVWNVYGNLPVPVGWKRLPDIPRRVLGAALAAWDGKIYLLGGIPEPYYEVETDRIDVYNIAARSWNTALSLRLPKPTAFAGYATVGKYLYIVAGHDTTNAEQVNVYRWDLTTGVWETGPALETRRAHFALVATQYHLYAMGGALADDHSQPMETVEVLDLRLWPNGGWVTYRQPAGKNLL